MSFLSAEWRKLVIVNYTINAELLKPYVPFGTELDLWKNKCYISLVGFMFLNTKLLGIKIPFHVNFEEVNLRFYVKRFENGAYKRGVVFIKEIVPKAALSFVANNVYNEHYETLPMQHVWKEDKQNLFVEYKWLKNNSWHTIAVNAEPELLNILTASETEFITEHYWGYAKVNEHVTNEYEVTHPKWSCYKIISHEISVDFESVYGKKFSFLNQQKPESVMLAEGSRITVENKKRL